MSKKLFLTSSVHAVAHHIAKKLDLKKANKLVFITTPAETETDDLSWLADDRKSLVDAGFKLTDYTITNKTKTQLEIDLADYDFIYMSGGNTLYLQQQSIKTGFIDVVKDLILTKGKTYIGTSAGSIITGPKCPDYLLEDHEIEQIKDLKGYGFVNFTILPHWGSEDFKEMYLSERLEIAYTKNQVPLILLTDKQYVEVVDDEIQIINTYEN